MPVFHYKNTDVYYDLFGNEGDPVITFVNGLSMRTSHWAPYFKILPAMGVRVLSYDMLGQGHSSKPILGVDFDDHAIMLKALHDHLGLAKPYVMGISFGGVVVLRYAKMFPDALKGLLPISTFSELDPQLSGHATNLYIGLARVGFEFYLDLLMPLNFSNEWMTKNHALLALIKRVGASQNEIYGIQNIMESLRNFTSITSELDDIKVPTLVLNGEYDALTPRHLHDIIRAHVHNSRMLVVPRMSHAFPLEIPELCSRIFADFINQVEKGTWQGDQSVWVANEDIKADEIAYPFTGDHLRYVPLPAAPKHGMTDKQWSARPPASVIPKVKSVKPVATKIPTKTPSKTPPKSRTKTAKKPAA